MKFFNELPQQQWLTKPDGNILETLTDSRVLATAGGASLEAVLEKYLWTQYRSTFGIASSVNGVVKFYAPDADGKAGAEAPQLGTNRQLVRLGLVALAATGIEYIPNDASSTCFWAWRPSLWPTSARTSFLSSPSKGDVTYAHA